MRKGDNAQSTNILQGDSADFFLAFSWLGTLDNVRFDAHHPREYSRRKLNPE
jgi:hypothetical protein